MPILKTGPKVFLIGATASILLAVLVWRWSWYLPVQPDSSDGSVNAANTALDAGGADSTGYPFRAPERAERSEPGSDSDEWIRSIYRVHSLSELEQLAVSEFRNSVDLDQVRQWVHDNCVMHNALHSPDSEALWDRWMKAESIGPEVKQRYRAADQYWRQFCDLDVTRLYDNEDLIAISPTFAPDDSSSDPDAEILGRIASILDEGRLGELEDQRRDLQLVLTRTRSPAHYERAVGFYMNHYARLGRIHPNLHDSDVLLPHGAMAVRVLARCRIFGDCGAGSLFMANLCRMRCPAAMDVHAYLREFHSPSVVRDAYIAAEILFSWRGAPTG